MPESINSNLMVGNYKCMGCGFKNSGCCVCLEAITTYSTSAYVN